MNAPLFQQPLNKGIIRISRVLLPLVFASVLCRSNFGQTIAEAGPESGGRQRQVTVTDAIEMTQIGNYSYLDAIRAKGDEVQFSPDRSKFAFVTQKGNLKNNTIEFSLHVFKTADAFSSPSPEAVAMLASSSNRESISHVSWLPDNDTIVFLGENPGESPQLYKVSCRTRSLERLTDQTQEIIAYAVSERGDRFVYVAKATLPPILSGDMLQHGFAVTTQEWEDLYTNRHHRYDTRSEIFVTSPPLRSAKHAGETVDIDENAEQVNLKISPNGRYALLQAYVTDPPNLWSAYEIEGLDASLTTPGKTGEPWDSPRQYLLVDLDEGAVNPLIGAPIFPFNRGSSELYEWTQQNSVLVINAFLPLETADPEEQNRRRTNLYAAEIKLPSREIVKIAERKTPLPVDQIHWDVNGSRFVAKQETVFGGSPLEFRRDATGWKVTVLNTPAEDLADRLSIILDQGMNFPPKLMAVDPKTRHKALLLDLNPQFANLSFGHVEIYNWKARDGHPMSGSLYYPPDFVRGMRYPLVIQTHGFNPERFWVDGPFSPAAAAQPLASKGFIVLQTDMGGLDVYEAMDTPKEAPREVASYEAAIDELDREGLIDRNRVGITGFSRTVYHVLYALAHSHYHFGAAVAADGIKFSYIDCLVVSSSSDVRRLCETMNGGGSPYGDSASGWLRTAPSFNLDKVKSPLLLQAITAPLSEWEIYGGLNWLRKPVELLNFYPEGDHILRKPWQRMTSQQTTVDWYCFWLKNEEDPDPAKAEQYKRWRELRKLQEQNEKKSANAASPTSN